MTKREFLKSYLEAEKQINLCMMQKNASSERVSEEVSNLKNRQTEVLTAIQTAPKPIMRAALTAHFVDGMPWSRVAYALGYGVDNMYKLLSSALQAMSFPAGVE